MDFKDPRPDRKLAAPAVPASHVREQGWKGAGRNRGSDPEDCVHIYTECRSSAGLATEAGESTTPSDTLAADRLIEIRRRIQARHHDDPEVIASIARRIVERGDL